MDTAADIKTVMKSNPVVISNEAPEELDLTKPDRSFQWTLHYKAVHNVGAQNFMGPKDKQEAFKLANQFCADRNWRFIQVRPLFMDIDAKPQTAEEREKYEK